MEERQDIQAMQFLYDMFNIIVFIVIVVEGESHLMYFKDEWHINQSTIFN